MKAVWMHKFSRSRLLVFFAGWAMDERPFKNLVSKQRDVLLLYDYRHMDEVPLIDEIRSYKEKDLCAWSFGCAAANQVVLEHKLSFSSAVAINGTVLPEDEESGVSARIISLTVARLANGGWGRFVRQMCPDDSSRESFEAGQPARSLKDAVEELGVLRRMRPPDSCIFKAAAVFEDDLVILPDNQRRCWDRYGVQTRSLKGPHYPFHLWSSWEEVLDCVR